MPSTRSSWRQAVAIAGEDAALREVGRAGDDRHRDGRPHPDAAVLVRPAGRRVDLGREVVGEEEDVHGGSAAPGPAWLARGRLERDREAGRRHDGRRNAAHATTLRARRAGDDLDLAPSVVPCADTCQRPVARLRRASGPARDGSGPARRRRRPSIQCRRRAAARRRTASAGGADGRPRQVRVAVVRAGDPDRVAVALDLGRPGRARRPTRKPAQTSDESAPPTSTVLCAAVDRARAGAAPRRRSTTCRR